jgi:hypothetical protein
MIGFTGWFNSFDIKNWHGPLREMKIVTKERAGKVISRIIVWQKKSVHFFGKGCCEKCTGKSKDRERKAKRVNCKN